ncbi:hypothetical protein A2U01_0087149, partial [Trifolium medium]|nr:hypothetical protein [Trifolium medium]
TAAAPSGLTATVPASGYNETLAERLREKET